MAATKQLAAVARSGVGKGAARSVRREGRVPGVIYGGGEAPEPISVDYKDLNKLVYAGHFLTTIFELDLAGRKDFRSQPTVTIDGHVLGLTDSWCSNGDPSVTSAPTRSGRSTASARPIVPPRLCPISSARSPVRSTAVRSFSPARSPT